MKEINVQGINNYNVYVGNNLFSEIDNFLDYSKYSKFIAIVDYNTDIININNSIEDILYLNVNERNKEKKTLFKIIDFLEKNKVNRYNTLVLGIGGGVLLDILGLAGSIYKRGINYAYIPTTLLSMVDASVGSKNAINYKSKKNLLGTFSDPAFVLVDPLFLTTLSHRQIKSGVAEILKIAFLVNMELILQLSGYENADYNWEDIITHCIKYKVSITQNDIYDRDLRKILNFGHTFGHAIERYYKYRKYTHGEAISIGMSLASENEDVIKVLKYFGLPTSLKSNVNFKKLFTYMLDDKKNTKDIEYVGLSAVQKPKLEYLLYTHEIEQKNNKSIEIENSFE